MQMRKINLILISIILAVLIIPLATATTLKGSVYNSNLEIEPNVLIQINTVPIQKFLTKDGNFQFELPPGKYTLSANKGLSEITEEIEIVQEGIFLYDIFLLDDFTDEDDIWQETEEDLIIDEDQEAKTYAKWRYWVAGLIIILLLWRFGRMRKKYGPLRTFRKEMKVEHKKTAEEHKEELAKEPGYLDNALEIIKKHDGRITQKQMRKEMLHLSEAKVSLILTELEHKGKIEKVKKGRGNVILLK
jgi:uncharacterized membrane protein